ncbi:FtsX-like permease family protein [Actinoallomurus sp. NPDC052274]|uniref:FtsX-like permease family protein n=1 Tax=Actinoallomurus sp. NPDC052274 TaxID=3155420 RepID=UPI00341A7F45
MLSIALATLKARWTAFAGAFVALALGVSIIATMGLVLAAAATGPHRSPQRFADVPAVVRAEPAKRVRDRYGTDVVPLAEQPALPAAVVARFPGAVLDRTFHAQVEGGPADQVGHAWSAAAFTPYRLVAGRAPGRPDEIVVGGGARSLIGGRVAVRTARETREYQVTGVTASVPFEHAVFFADAEAARISPEVDALVPRGRVSPVPGTQVLTGDARHLADPGAAQDATDLDALQSFLAVMALVAGFVSLYVTASAFGLTITQRRRELALLRTTGATPGQVMRMVCLEATLVGAIGAAAGCGLGLWGGPVLAGWMTARGMAPSWFGVGLSAGSVLALAVAFLVGVAIAVLSVAVAAARAGRIRPVEALREAAVDRRAITRVRTLLGWIALAGGLVMLAAIVVAYPAGATDLKTVVQLALLLIAATGLLTPVLLPPLIRILSRPFTYGAGGLLVRENSLTAVRRASAAVAPVLITVGLACSVLGASGAVDSATDHDLRRQAARADYVVLPVGGAQLNRTVIDRIRAVPGIEATTVTSTTLFAHEPALTALHLEAPMPVPYAAQAVDETTVLDLPVVEGSLAGLNTRTIAVDRSWHRHVGDTMPVWLADGTPVALRVTAVVDAGLGDGLVIDSRNAGRSLPERIYVRIRPGADRPAALAALRTATHGVGAQAVPTGRWTAVARDRQGRQTELGLVVLLGVAIAYSALAIANTFLTSVAGRGREFALLRLTGATRRQILAMAAGEALLLTAVGGVLAAVASALLLAVVGAALGRLVGTPVIAVPWSTMGLIVAGSALLAVLASVAPAGLRLRARPMEAAGVHD